MFCFTVIYILHLKIIQTSPASHTRHRTTTTATTTTEATQIQAASSTSRRSLARYARETNTSPTSHSQLLLGRPQIWMRTTLDETTTTSTTTTTTTTKTIRCWIRISLSPSSPSIARRTITKKMLAPVATKHRPREEQRARTTSIVTWWNVTRGQMPASDANSSPFCSCVCCSWSARSSAAFSPNPSQSRQMQVAIA